MNQKVVFYLLGVFFLLFISCSDMLSDYTGHHGPSSVGDVQITHTAMSYKPSLVWTGSEYGLSWYDCSYSSQIYFTRISAAGVKQGSDVQITNIGGSSSPSLVWTGMEYGVAWAHDYGRNTDIYFARISTAGVKQDSDVRITNVTGNSVCPSLVWNGIEYGLSWNYNPDFGDEIYFTRISAVGVKIGGNKRITNFDYDSKWPSLIFTGTGYGLSWVDERNSLEGEIYFARLNDDGTKIASDIRITNASSYSEHPSLVWTGTEYGVVWEDARDGIRAIYFARISASGVKQGPDIKITNPTGVLGGSFHPSLVWTGTEYGLAWQEFVDINHKIYFTRISPTGVKQGPNVRITNTESDSEHSSLVWTGFEYGLAWDTFHDGNREIYFVRLYPNGTKK